MKILEWISSRRSDALVEEGPASSSISLASSSMGDQPRVTPVKLETNLVLLLEQIGVKDTGASFAAGGFRTIEDLAKATEEQLVSLGLKKGVRMKIGKWRSANFKGDEEDAESPNAPVATGGGGGASAGNADVVVSLAPQDPTQFSSPFEEFLRGKLKLPEESWAGLSRVGIASESALLSADEETLVAAGLKRGPRIKISKLSQEKRESINASSSATTILETPENLTPAPGGTAALIFAPLSAEAEPEPEEPLLPESLTDLVVLLGLGDDAVAALQGARIFTISDLNGPDPAAILSKAAVLSSKKRSKLAKWMLKNTVCYPARISPSLGPNSKAARSTGAAEEPNQSAILLRTEFTEAEMIEDLSKRKLPALKVLCEELGIDSNGSKKALTDRLDGRRRKQAAAAESAAIAVNGERSEDYITEPSGVETAPASNPAAPAGPLILSTAAQGALEAAGCGEWHSNLAKAGLQTVSQLAEEGGAVEIILRDLGVKKGPRVKLRKAASAVLTSADFDAAAEAAELGASPAVGRGVDVDNDHNGGTEVETDASHGSVGDTGASEEPFEALDAEASENEPITEETVEGGSGAPLDNHKDVTSRSDVQLEEASNVSAEIEGIITDEGGAVAVSGGSFLSSLTSAASSVFSALSGGASTVSSVKSSSVESGNSKTIAGDETPRNFAAESDLCGDDAGEERLVGEAPDSAEMRLGVGSRVMLPMDPNTRRSAFGSESAREYGEILIICRNPSVDSGVLVKMKKVNPPSSMVVRQREAYVERDFASLAELPSDSGFASPRAPFNEDAGDEAADVRTTEEGVMSLREWVSYFSRLENQEIGVRSIVRPQLGWRHPHSWGGGTEAPRQGPSGALDPFSVWGVFDAALQGPSLTTVTWFSIGRTGLEAIGRPLEGAWSIADVEVVRLVVENERSATNTFEEHALHGLQTHILNGLLSIQGCIAPASVCLSLEGWRAIRQIPGRSSKGKIRILAVLQTLRLVHGILLELCRRGELPVVTLSGRDGQVPADDVAVRRIWRTTSALYRRILIGGYSSATYATHPQTPPPVSHSQHSFDELADDPDLVDLARGWFQGFLTFAESPRGLGASGPEQVALFEQSLDDAWQTLTLECAEDKIAEVSTPFSEVDAFIPSPDIPASLIIDSGHLDSKDSLMAISLGANAGCSNIRRLLSPTLARIRFDEAIQQSQASAVASLMVTKNEAGTEVVEVHFAKEEYMQSLAVFARSLDSKANEGALKVLCGLGEMFPVSIGSLGPRNVFKCNPIEVLHMLSTVFILPNSKGCSLPFRLSPARVCAGAHEK